MRTLLLAAVAAFGLPAFAATTGTTLEGVLPPELRAEVELVYVEHVDGSFKPAGPAIMDQRNLAYVPHVLPVLRGTSVQFRSHDRELHNVFARGPDHRVLFNLAVLPHMQIEKTFDMLGVTELSCNVHKAMLAFVPVLQNPYWATPDANGRWQIPGLPAGHYVLRVWGERLEDAARGQGFPVDVGVAARQVVQLGAH